MSIQPKEPTPIIIPAPGGSNEEEEVVVASSSPKSPQETKIEVDKTRQPSKLAKKTLDDLKKEIAADDEELRELVLRSKNSPYFPKMMELSTNLFVGNDEEKAAGETPKKPNTPTLTPPPPPRPTSIPKNPTPLSSETTGTVVGPSDPKGSSPTQIKELPITIKITPIRTEHKNKKETIPDPNPEDTLKKPPNSFSSLSFFDSSSSLSSTSSATIPLPPIPTNLGPKNQSNNTPKDPEKKGVNNKKPNTLSPPKSKPPLEHSPRSTFAIQINKKKQNQGEPQKPLLPSNSLDSTQSHRTKKTTPCLNKKNIGAAFTLLLSGSAALFGTAELLHNQNPIKTLTKLNELISEHPVSASFAFFAYIVLLVAAGYTWRSGAKEEEQQLNSTQQTARV